MTVADSFHPDFYVAMATVLPLLLLTTGLVGRWLRADHRVRPPAVLRPIRFLLYRHVDTFVFAAVNSVAEVLCLIVLFNRSANTSVDVAIWIGFSVSWMFVLAWFLVFVTDQKRGGSDTTSDDP